MTVDSGYVDDVARDSIPTWCFALVLVKRGHRFLLVHERKHG